MKRTHFQCRRHNCTSNKTCSGNISVQRFRPQTARCSVNTSRIGRLLIFLRIFATNRPYLPIYSCVVAHQTCNYAFTSCNGWRKHRSSRSATCVFFFRLLPLSEAFSPPLVNVPIGFPQRTIHPDVVPHLHRRQPEVGRA